MEKRQGILVFSSVIVLILMTAAILFPRKPDEAENIQYLTAMESIKDTQLGKLSPTATVDMSVFLSTAVPYLTFEHGQAPVTVALKQVYIDKLEKDSIRRNDALSVLFKMIGVNVKNKDQLFDKAQVLAIITDKDKSLHENNKLSASEACYLIVKAKEAFYNILANSTRKEIDITKYFYKATDFTFSENGRILWYNDEGGALNAINTEDGSFSVITKPETPELEKYEPKTGEAVINIYDNNKVLRAVSVEASSKPGYVTDKYILYRTSETSPWVRFIEFDLSSSRQFEIIGFSEDNKKMYVKTNFYDNYITLYEIDPVTKSRQVVWKNKEADIVDSIIAKSIGFSVTDLFHPETGKLLSTIYINDKPRLICLDDTLKTIMEAVNEAMGENIFPIAISGDFKFLVLKHMDSFDLGTYYLYNTATKTSKLLATPGISEDAMGYTFPVSYTTSDDDIIYGYLTLPRGKKPENLPLIVNVHSGYTSRFSWTPTAETVLAVSEGYAVLSVNSRLSIGYGNEYIDSVTKDLLLPQKDIYEMTQWMIELGIAEKSNISIMGHSYGGYSALYQAAVHPELYNSAVSMMGIWDWNSLGHELAGNEPYPEWYLRFAPVPDSEMASFMSPSTYANKIKCPVLIIYSGQDEIVYPSQNITAIADLTLSGNKPETMYIPNGKHYITDRGVLSQILDQIKDFYNSKAAFLSEHKEQ